MGGILNILAHTVRIKGMPLAIPDDVIIDVTPLELSGHGITCADLTIPENVVLEEEPEKVCVSIIAPKTAEEEAAEAEEEAETAEAEAEESAEATEEQ